eukprot:c38369_g1_i1 orf=3-164(-)
MDLLRSNATRMWHAKMKTNATILSFVKESINKAKARKTNAEHKSKNNNIVNLQN